MLRLTWVLMLPALLAGCKNEPKNVQTDFVKIYGLTFSPAQPVAEQDLTVAVGHEALNKAKVSFSYKWYVDGKVVQEGKSNVLPGKDLIPGARVYLEYQAHSGSLSTAWMRSEEMAVGQPKMKITKVAIEPGRPSLDQALTATYECENCEGLRFYYRWIVNGNLLEDQTEEQLSGSAAELKPGDRVVAEISPETEYPKVWYDSSPVTIVSRPPEFEGGGSYWLEGNVFYFKFSAHDPDSGALTYKLLEGPPGAQLDPASQTLKWNLPPNYKGGEIRIRIQAKNPGGGANILEATISISEQTTEPKPPQ